MLCCVLYLILYLIYGLSLTLTLTLSFFLDILLPCSLSYLWWLDVLTLIRPPESLSSVSFCVFSAGYGVFCVSIWDGMAESGATFTQPVITVSGWKCWLSACSAPFTGASSCLGVTFCLCPSLFRRLDVSSICCTLNSCLPLERVGNLRRLRWGWSGQVRPSIPLDDNSAVMLVCCKSYWSWCLSWVMSLRVRCLCPHVWVSSTE